MSHIFPDKINDINSGSFEPSANSQFFIFHICPKQKFISSEFFEPFQQKLFIFYGDASNGGITRT